MESQEAKIAKLESLLESETLRAEGWIKQYNILKSEYEKLKADFELTVAITGNRYTFK